MTHSAETFSFESIFQSRPNLHLLNLPYISLPCYQCNFPTILHCSWVIKRRDLNTFSAFSRLRARLKGSRAACLPQSAIRRSGRTARKRERGGWGGTIYNCQIREKSLCVKWGSLYVSLPARRFLFLCMETCMFLLRTHCWGGKCGCLADTVGWCVSN